MQRGINGYRRDTGGIQLIQFTRVLRVHDTDSDAPLNNRYKNMTPLN